MCTVLLKRSTLCRRRPSRRCCCCSHMRRQRGGLGWTAAAAAVGSSACAWRGCRCVGAGAVAGLDTPLQLVFLCAGIRIQCCSDNLVERAPVCCALPTTQGHRPVRPCHPTIPTPRLCAISSHGVAASPASPAPPTGPHVGDGRGSLRAGAAGAEGTARAAGGVRARAHDLTCGGGRCRVCGSGGCGGKATAGCGEGEWKRLVASEVLSKRWRACHEPLSSCGSGSLGQDSVQGFTGGNPW